jgi:predicted hydrocarbon binding protein/KaiC/GvpD/RAD55 family RecA-like ATPase
VSITQLQEIPSNSLILLVGPPGSGKTTFCQQVALHSLAVDRPVIYVTTECSPSKAEEALREKGLGRIESGLLSFVDAYNETVGLSVTDRPDTVQADCANLSSIGVAISKLQERIRKKGVLLVFDSLVSPYLLSGPEVVRFLRLTLARFVAEGNGILACMDEGCGKQEDLGAMMSLSNGVIKMDIEGNKQLLNVVKHPKATPTRIEVLIESERVGIETRTFNWRALKQFFEAFWGGSEAFWRREVGDFVNLFWPTLVPWSGMLWDPKRYPMMIYQANKDDVSAMFKNEEFIRVQIPWHMRLLMKLFMPKNLSRVKDVKKIVANERAAREFQGRYEQERSGIVEYLEGASKTDEHYFRIYESFECCGFENVGAAMASYLPPMIAGMCKGFECLQGVERDWNAVETKCIGLGDPYCEIKVVPGEISELEDSLEKDVIVLERIRDRLMDRLMGFLLHGKPLVKRPRLGSDIQLHPVNHIMGGENIPAMGRVWGERYRMGLRMGGAKAGKEVGEHLMDARLKEDEAVKRILKLLEHCKVGKVAIDGTIRMKENCENALSKIQPMTLKAPSCYFTTGFLNGFFSSVKNQHVKEIKCIAMGDPYCEWEFR